MLALVLSTQAYSLGPALRPAPPVGARAALLTMADGPSAKEVKALRDMTGAGMMDCKKALVENNEDMEAAMEFLRKKGLASAEKKASRAAKEGIIETYIHTGAKLGVMVEVNCETDFVAKRPEFQELAKAVAMQIAASPTVEVVSENDISADFIEREKKIEAQSEDLQGKPEQIVEKIVSGAHARARAASPPPRSRPALPPDACASTAALTFSWQAA